MNSFSLNEINNLIEIYDFCCPLNDSFLDARYQWQKEVNGAEWPYYRFFYYLTKYLQPKTIVELGGYQGTAAAHFAAGYPKSTIITIDHHSNPGDEENKDKMLQACNIYPNLYYVQGWTTQALANEQKGNHGLGDVGTVYPEVVNILNGQHIDILFIDSWHNYKYAMADWEVYSPLLSTPALVICDDISTVDSPTISGMMDFWNELEGERFLNFTLHPGCGLGFLKYRDAI